MQEEILVKVFVLSVFSLGNFDGAKEYCFQWTMNHLKQKLEHFGEKGVSSQPFQIKGDSADDTVSLKLTMSLQDRQDSSSLYPTLEKLFSTCHQDVTIWWRFQCVTSVILDSGVHKWTIPKSACSSKCNPDNVDMDVNSINYDRPISAILNMEVLWPEEERDATPKDQEVTPLFKEFEVLLGDGKYSDMKLVCQDREFSCHKVVLAARSPVFDAMFSSGNSLEVQEGKVNMTDMDPDKLEVFLKYLYTGKFSEDMKRCAKALFVAADKFHVESLKLAAGKALTDNVNSENAIDMLLLADMYNVNMLKKKTMKVIIGNYDIISKQQQWNDFKQAHSDIVNLIEISVENFGI